tara:strand:- start:192 stop:626 length:435 start_codon:yes stop_codon:yes gene_type:complete
MNKFDYMDNVFDLKPLPQKTFKDLLIDNARDLWDKHNECVLSPDPDLENELIELLCKAENQPDHPYIHDALIIGADSGDFEQLLIAFKKANPEHPLAIHVDKSLRGYLPLVIEAAEQADNTISQAYADEEQAWKAEENRYDYDL